MSDKALYFVVSGTKELLNEFERIGSENGLERMADAVDASGDVPEVHRSFMTNATAMVSSIVALFKSTSATDADATVVVGKQTVTVTKDTSIHDAAKTIETSVSIGVIIQVKIKHKSD